jgi:hypothetical protein
MLAERVLRIPLLFIPDSLLPAASAVGGVFTKVRVIEFGVSGVGLRLLFPRLLFDHTYHRHPLDVGSSI